MIAAPPDFPRTAPRRSGSGPGGRELPPAEALLGTLTQTLHLLRWLLAGLVGIYLGSGITRVGPQEDAFIVRLGRLQPEVHPPGLLLALPTPFDRVVKVPTRQHLEISLNAWSPDEEHPVLGATPASPLPAAPTAGRPPGLHPVFVGYTLTGDKNLIQGRFGVRYRITDPAAWIRAASADSARALIESQVLAAATRALAGRSIDDALGRDLESFRREVLTAAQARVDRLALGVTLTAFEVAVLTPPAATVPAFADVTSAQVEAHTMTENARTYAARIRPEAESAAFRVRQEAETAAHALTSRARAEAASFRALADEHRLAPAAVATRLRTETLAAVLAQVAARKVLPAGENLQLWLPDKP